MSVKEQLRNAHQRYHGQVLSALEVAHSQREHRAAFSAYSGFGCGAGTARRPLRARLEALVGIFASDAPVAFLGRAALQALMRAVGAEPFSVGKQFGPHPLARQWHLQHAGTFRLERSIEPFDTRDAAVFADGAEALQYTILTPPASLRCPLGWAVLLVAILVAACCSVKSSEDFGISFAAPTGTMSRSNQNPGGSRFLAPAPDLPLWEPFRAAEPAPFVEASQIEPGPRFESDPLPDSFGAFFKLLGSDAFTTLKSPLGWRTKGWCLFGITAVVIYGTSRYTDHVLDTYNQGPNRTMERRLWTHVSDWGVAIPYLLLGAHGLIGYGWAQEHAKRVFLDGVESVVIVSTLLLVLKISIGRSLPDSKSRAFQFKPFNNGWDTAFPSGHTVQAFIGATVLAASYPDQPWVAIGALSIASGVAFSRLYLHEHWLSDVIAGAVLAVAVGWEIVNLHRHPVAGQDNASSDSSGYLPARIGLIQNGSDTGLSLEWRF